LGGGGGKAQAIGVNQKANSRGRRKAPLCDQVIWHPLGLGGYQRGSRNSSGVEELEKMQNLAGRGKKKPCQGLEQIATTTTEEAD